MKPIKFILFILLVNFNSSLSYAGDWVLNPETLLQQTDPLYQFATIPTSYNTFNPELQFSKRRLEVMAAQNYLSPTLFSVKYLIDPASPQSRKLGWFYCYNHKLRLRYRSNGTSLTTQDYNQSCDKLQDFHQQQTWTENGRIRYSKDFSHFSDFDRKDLRLIKELNDTFLEKPCDYGSFSLQHGHKTPKVFVFVHGFMKNDEYFKRSAENVFYEGSNVIVANLPGHENQMVGTHQYVSQWLAFIETLTYMAREYGDEVILIGHSLGANLVLHAAEKELVNKIILIQPLIKISHISKFGYNLMRFLSPDRIYLLDLLASKGFREGSKAHELVNIVEEAIKLEKIPFRKFPKQLKVLAYLSHVDLVISSNKAIAFLKQELPQATIRMHYADHMAEPDTGFWNDVKVQEFIHEAD